MKRARARLPLWTKLLLVFLLLCTILSVSLTLLLRFAEGEAAEGELPAVWEYRLCAVLDERFEPRYPAGSLLLLHPQEEYRPGDAVLAGGQDGILVTLHHVGRQRAEGIPVGGTAELTEVSLDAIAGSVTCGIPALGSVYDWMTGGMGLLLFVLVPGVLTLVWIAVMLCLSAKRRAASPTKAAEPRKAASRPRQGSYEPFDLFEEPVELDYLRQSIGEEEPAAPEVPSPAQEEQPPEPEPQPEPKSESEQATGDPALASEFAPAYLHRDVSHSLEELRESLRQSAPAEVDILGDVAVGMDEKQQRSLEQIGEFDPDKVIAEIKRKNALYQSRLP